jgi:hypothetical protein
LGTAALPQSTDRDLCPSAWELGTLAHVQSGDPPLAPEVLRVRPGVDAGDAHYETHPVHRRDVAAPKGLGEGDLGLTEKQGGVGRRVVLRGQVGMVDLPDLPGGVRELRDPEAADEEDDEEE